ncbi:hypothetical protein LQZ24_04455 [Fructobacillus sp. M1-13]|uniref:Uncharacterized protein n=1 Tax=Fructobacillus papyriferae TaxID=2713171 RepID=A0ABS5QSZ7_9LACO|nr:hypothetical protein [Fructobacillus papyriferae]MBS9335506.1 hypothetical protein [Fructobacillus papyriferae]MCD2159276.1 hypothetical protein [Fructobacillus papyriferae]
MIKKIGQQTLFFTLIYAIVFVIDTVVEVFFFSKGGASQTVFGLKYQVVESTHALQYLHFSLPAVIVYLILLLLWLGIYFKFIRNKELPDPIDVITSFFLT